VQLERMLRVAQTAASFQSAYLCFLDGVDHSLAAAGGLCVFARRERMESISPYPIELEPSIPIATADFRHEHILAVAGCESVLHSDQ
jgi:hypothetical protein